MPKPLYELSQLQRSQLSSMKKDELIEIIPSTSGSDDVSFQTVIEKFMALTKMINNLKPSLISHEGIVNKNIKELQIQVDKQGEAIVRQHSYLKYLDRKKRE